VYARIKPVIAKNAATQAGRRRNMRVALGYVDTIGRVTSSAT